MQDAGAVGWFAQIFGEEFGPLTDGKLRQMVAEETITGDTPVRRGTSGAWRPAEEWEFLDFPRTTTEPAVPVTAQPPAAIPATTPVEEAGSIKSGEKRVAADPTARSSWTPRRIAAVAGMLCAVAASVSVLVYVLPSGPTRSVQGSAASDPPEEEISGETAVRPVIAKADGGERARPGARRTEVAVAPGYGDIVPGGAVPAPASFGVGGPGFTGPPPDPAPSTAAPADQEVEVAAASDRSAPVAKSRVEADAAVGPRPGTTVAEMESAESGGDTVASATVPPMSPPAEGANVIELNNAALAEVTQRHFDEALDLWEQAAAIEPSTPGVVHNVGRAATLADRRLLPTTDRERQAFTAFYSQLTDVPSSPVHRPRVGWLHMASSPEDEFEDRDCPICLGTGEIPCSQPDCTDGSVTLQERYVAAVDLRGKPIYMTRPARVSCTTCGGDDAVRCQHCDGGGADPHLIEPPPAHSLVRLDTAKEAFEFVVTKTAEFHPLMPRKERWENVVFVEPEGDRFHAEECQFGLTFDTAMVATIPQARQMGRTPCRICGGHLGLTRTIPGVDWGKPERAAAGAWVVDGTHPEGRARMTVFLNEYGKWRVRLATLGRRRLYVNRDGG